MSVLTVVRPDESRPTGVAEPGGCEATGCGAAARLEVARPMPALQRRVCAEHLVDLLLDAVTVPGDFSRFSVMRLT